MGNSAAAIPQPKGVITDVMMSGDMIPATPRLRMSLDRSLPLSLDNTWQTVPWVSTNTPYDTNTFITPRYNTANNSIMPNTGVQYDQNYTLELDFKFSHTKRPLTFQLRFCVPRPAGSGGPIYFPLPQSDQYTDLLSLSKTYTGGLLGNLLAIGNLSLTEDTSVMTNRVTYFRTLYSSLGAKQYGIQIQLRIAEGYAGNQRPQLVDAVMLLQPN